MFTYIITQPYLFAVSAPQEDSSDKVRAAYEQLLEQSSSQSDGSIQFETLIVGENGAANITYGVAAGDNLSSIAKNFGTTTEAIAEANNLTADSILRPGQKLTITYDDGVIVNIKQTMSVDEYCNKYDLDKEEFLSMNYFEDQDMMLEEGWQVFVPLNQVEAEKKGLVEKEQFVELDLPQEQFAITDPIIQQGSDGIPTSPEEITTVVQDNNIPQVQITDSTNYEQTVITAEQTQAHLKGLEQAKIDAQNAAKEAKIQAEIEAERAKEAQRQAEIEQSRKAREAAAVAQKRAEEAQRQAEVQKQRAIAAAAAQEEARKNQIVTCPANQCLHKGKCWTPPNNAICAETDNNNAWVCIEGYTEYGGGCISADSAIVRAPTKGTSTQSQWYFNPHKVDSNVYGWGPGHCTAMAAYLWSQNYGIRIRDYWTGNAKDWLVNARKAGFTVNSTPKPGSLMVTGYGYGGRGPYGHVMYVESVDLANGLVTVVDMNYKGRYIATRRTEAINKARGFIHPK